MPCCSCFPLTSSLFSCSDTLQPQTNCGGRVSVTQRPQRLFWLVHLAWLLPGSPPASCSPPPSPPAWALLQGVSAVSLAASGWGCLAEAWWVRRALGREKGVSGPGSWSGGQSQDWKMGLQCAGQDCQAQSHPGPGWAPPWHVTLGALFSSHGLTEVAGAWWQLWCH